MKRASFCIVGPGAVGSSLALRLVNSGHDVAVAGRSEGSTRELADRLGGASWTTSLSEVSRHLDWIVLCVPDDVLPTVVRNLADSLGSLRDTRVAHTSGLQSIDVLNPVAELGATPLGFHPLQSFPQRFDPDAFTGCYVGIEAADEPFTEASNLARSLGSRPIRVATEDKPIYHLAASIASNFLVTLLAQVDHLASRKHPPSEWDLGAFIPLINRTLRNATTEGPREALTGAFARGDVSTIQGHLEAMQDLDRSMTRVYAALGRETLRLALQKDQEVLDRANQILSMLSQAEQARTD